MKTATAQLIDQRMARIDVPGWRFVNTALDMASFDREAVLERSDGSRLRVCTSQNDIADRLRDFDRRHPWVGHGDADD